MRLVPATALLLSLLLAPAAAASNDLSGPREAAAAALEALCAGNSPAALDDPEALEADLPGFALSDVEDAGPPEFWVRREVRLVAAGQDLALVITALRPGGSLRQLSVEVQSLGEGRPLLLVLADPLCGIRQARALSYRDGTAAELLHLAPDLDTVTAREPLDPPVPPGSDPAQASVTVAHVDSGVNYLLPAIAARLARDGTGALVGYDFWDLDPRPFDGDTARSPFFPLRHGTEVTSLLLHEAPQVRVVPFRYPRPDMGRMAEVVTAADAAGAAVVALPMGSRRQSDWQAFQDAAAAHPDLLFIVSAGNDGRDIDEAPVYPAVLTLANMIVVTSAEDDGSVAPGSNWGAVSVDLLVPAEHRQVTGFDGTPALGSGSSFAVPRVAALAARLKAAHPAWRADDLKAAIFALATPPPPQSQGAVAVGWLTEAALSAP